MKAIWELAGPPGGTASTKDFVERLSISPASVTNMFGRLRKMGLVEYERYRVLSYGKGRAEALRLVRRHLSATRLGTPTALPYRPPTGPCPPKRSIP